MHPSHSDATINSTNSGEHVTQNDVSDSTVVGETQIGEFQPPQAFGHNGDVWEDILDGNTVKPQQPPQHITSQTPARQNPSSSKHGSQRAVRRRKGGKTSFIAQPTPIRKPFKNKSNQDTAPPSSNLDGGRSQGALAAGVGHTYVYAYDVLRRAFWVLKTPFAVLVALWILAFLFTRLSAAFRAFFTSLCCLPILNRTPFCQRPLDFKKVPQWADFPRLSDIQSNAFEQLLDESVGSSGLSLEIKKAEMATSDLVALVKASDLKSKDLLAKSLEDFVGAARKSGRGLQKLSSKIGGAVDRILAVNDHALHSIQDHEAKGSRVVIRLNPLSYDLSTKQFIAQKFDDAMTVLSSQMQRIILEAKVSISNLDNLERRLVALHELLMRENASITSEKEQLLAELWTILGGNKKKVKGLVGHLHLLKSIGEYRIRALAHVTAALHALQRMSEDVEDLRERVTAPELTGDKIPVEVHMKSIKAGLDRLTEQRAKSRVKEEGAQSRFLGEG